MLGEVVYEWHQQAESKISQFNIYLSCEINMKLITVLSATSMQMP